MLIKYQALATVLKKPTAAFYVLLGSDPYLLGDAAMQVKQTFLNRIQLSSECAQKVLDIQSPADWSWLVSEANSYTLFSDYVLLDARFDKKSIDTTGKALLSEYLLAANAHCMIMLRAPLLSAKSLTWLSESPHVIVIQNYPLSPVALKQWIAAQLQAKALQTEPGVAEIIYQYTQGNMLATAQLIQKLSLCTTPLERITVSMVREHLSDQSHFELYELADACLDAKPEHAIRLLQQFHLERIEPTLILWILTQEVRLLIQLYYLLKQPLSIDQSCQQLKIWSSRVRLYASASKRLSLSTLLQLLHQCKQLDDLIKTSQTLGIWNTLDTLALSLSGVLL